MNKTCGTKPSPSTKTRLSELISWRLLKKNPSGALIWGIFGASLIMDGYFWVHFLRRKEYQVDHKKRMWNERLEMLEKPIKMKLYYSSDEVMPKPCQPLIDVYKQMLEAESGKCKIVQECICAVETTNE
ncbi:uncharacterized protein LOC114129173 [Aphis gossypii]|uniref:Uncharacterized protein n=1 Tax=Aphis gossypii TaxID=80765 RepID=A0A9P0NGJ3_APHGO|nr:uncharacterized protein LOC114129173 [Aphis gossypii]CAH1714519.1 unnamed protein product [Aphis gossypii]